MMRTRLSTGLAAGALLALSPAGLAQYSARDFLESASTFEAPAGAAEDGAALGGSTGATFAADAAPEVCPDAEPVANDGRPMIGVLLEEGDGAPRVQRVIAGSPAEEAGLRAGDVLVSVGDRFIGDLAALRRALGGLSIGDEVDLGVDRDGKAVLFELTLADSETLDLPEGPEDLEEIEEIEEEEPVEEPVVTDFWIEDSIEVELAELEDIASGDVEVVEIEDVVLEDVTNGFLVQGAHGIVVLEDVTLDVPDGEASRPQVLRLRTTGPNGAERVEVLELEGGGNVIFGDTHVDASGEHGVRLHRNIAVPVAPKTTGACCDCECSCSASAGSEPKGVAVWTTRGPNGVTMRQASKQVDVAAEVARTLKASGIDDARIAEVLKTLESHQLDGELAFGLQVRGEGAAAPRVQRRREVRLEGPTVGYGGPEGLWVESGEHAHGEHGPSDHGHDPHGHDARERVDVSFGWTAEAPHAPHGAGGDQQRRGVRGTNAAEAPSSGYFFDSGSNVEVDVQHLQDAHGRRPAHPQFQRSRIQKPKRPSTDAAEGELQRLRAELQALRQEIRDLRAAIRARGR